MEKEYTLSELISALLKRVWIIILFVVIFTVGAFLFTRIFIEKKYTASVSMYVAPNAAGSEVIAAATLSDLNYAQKVVNTYIEILMTNAFMESVAQKDGLDFSAAQLKGMVNIRAVNQTEIFKISVTTSAPELSLQLANTIAEMAPEKIIEIKDADAVRVVDPAVLPRGPSSPNLMKNTAIGALLGLVLSVLLVIALDWLDIRIKDEEDFKKHYNVPLLGAIPTFTGSAVN
ncbi:MAG: hypothetical protein GX823_01810 [Clostridiales bacterium]|nr:hypothetical protein [Clostridiales bacterium]